MNRIARELEEKLRSLDPLRARYGVRFKKERDALRLAELFQPGEIDSEIKEIIIGFGQE